MPAITSANVANAIVKLVAVDALPALMGNLIMGNLVTRDFEPTLARAGDTVNVPVPIQDAGLGNVPVVLSTHAEATFQVPDVTKILAVPDLLKLYMQPAVVALAERIEADLLSLHSQFNAHPSVGVAGQALTLETVDSADTALFNGRVAANAPKFLVVDGAAYSQLRQLPRFSEYSSTGEAGLRAIVDGPVEKIRDFYVFRSHLVQKTGSGPATTQSLAFTKTAIGLVTRRLSQPLPGTGVVAEHAELGSFGIRVLLHYSPNTLSQQFTIDLLYGTAVLRNTHGVQVRS